MKTPHVKSNTPRIDTHTHTHTQTTDHDESRRGRAACRR